MVKRRSIGAACLLACVGAAHAAGNSLQIYGTVDDGLTYVSNQGGGRLFKMDAGIGQPDRFGIKGREDLGGGLAAVFQLEQGFNTSSGALINSGVEWNRQAWVGLASDRFGTVSIGHQTDFMQDVSIRFSNGFWQHNLYAYHPGNLDNLANSSQIDNAVKWNSMSFHGLTGGLMYGFAGGNAQGRTAGAYVKYDNGALSMAATYVSINKRTFDFSSRLGISSIFGQSALSATKLFQSDAVNNTGIGASYRISSRWNVHALYTRSEVRAPGGSGNMFNYDVGTEYRVTEANALTLGYSYSSFNHTHYNQIEAGDLYSFSKRTQLQAQVTYIGATGNNHAASYPIGASSNHDQMLVRVGMYHSF
ncbi:porin [Pandoraea sputorum]